MALFLGEDRVRLSGADGQGVLNLLELSRFDKGWVRAITDVNALFGC